MSLKYIGIAILLLFVSSVQVDACRFMVREIGFSILSQDIYTIAVIDENANPNDNFWKEFQDKNRDCNLQLEVLNAISDSEHSIIINAKQKGLKFPVTVLVAPDSRMFVFEENDILKIYNKILESGLGVNLRNIFPDVFAAVIWVGGKDAEKNRIAGQHVRKDCDAIENIMPGMPKVVKHGPVEIAISESDFQNEGLLLWSLGIDSIPNEPVAFVLYGRGRIMGKSLNYQQILDGGLYKYMSMIGADCECGLDKKWMLGHQIPLLWDRDSRQYLAKLMGFDIDNPMILAEMSRIMAMETMKDATGSVAFAPETIDLDEVFGNSAIVNNAPEKKITKDKSNKILWYTLISLFVVVIIVGGLIFWEKYFRIPYDWKRIWLKLIERN